MTSSVFPGALDSFVDPNPTSKCNATNTTGPVALHSALHGLENDAIAALQVKVGIDSSADHNSLDYKIAAALAAILALQGTSLLYGSGAPAGGDGVDGNFYLDETAHELYGPKAGGAWPAGTSLIGPTGATGANGHGSTTTTAAPTASGGNWLFTVGDTIAFNAVGAPIFCGDGTNSISGTVYNVVSSTQVAVAPTTTTGTVTSIATGSTFTFSGVRGPAGATGATGGSGGGITRVSRSANYTITTSDGNTFFDCTGTITLSLPAASSAGNSFGIEIFNSGTGWVTVPCNGTDTMLGMFGKIARYRLDPGMGIKIICTGTGWEIRGRMSSIIHPCELFLSTYTKGGIYAPGDWSTVWQNTAGTTPITATLQNIQRINDVSGAGNDFSQATAGSAPRSSNGMGFNCADFGTLRYWDAVGGAVFSSDEFTVACAVRSNGVAAAMLVDTRGLGAAGTLKGWYARSSNTGTTQFAADDGASHYATLNDVGALAINKNMPLVTSWGPTSQLFNARYLPMAGAAGSGFISGISAAAGTVGGITTTNTSRIGSEIGGTTQPFNGLLAGLTVLPVHLTHGAAMEALIAYYANLAQPQ